MNPRQFERAQNVVSSLLFKGINQFCERDIQAVDKCVSFYKGSYPDGKLRPGQCARESEMASICRLYAAESISVSCKNDVARLTQAVGTKQSESDIAALTDTVYKCGLTPSPLYSGERSELPAGMINALKKGMLDRERDEAFHAVLVKQIQDRESQATASKQQRNDKQ